MADVTAGLLWYRLTETSDQLLVLWDGIQFIADAGGTILNYIFMFWLMVGLLTIIIVTIIQQHESRHNVAHHDLNDTEYICQNCRGAPMIAAAGVPTIASHDERNIDWLNSVLKWLNVNDTGWKAPILENLLTTMTDESRKLGGDLFVTFEALLPVGDPPVLNITRVNNSSAGKMILQGEIQLSGLQLSLTASDNSVAIHSNLLLIIHHLKSQVEVELESTSEHISLLVRAGDLTTSDIQFSPYHQGVDCITDERKLIQHVTSIFTQLVLPVDLKLQTVVAQELYREAEIELSRADSLNAGRPPKPPRSIEDKRLMIKLIKATRLNKRTIATMDAYCIVEVDKPFQTHSTSVVKNTVNPYWDEHFLFDLGTCTSVVTFRVYGNSKAVDVGSRTCLGETQIDLERLRVNHGIRMVLPLENRPDIEEPVSGSVTIEAFFVDSAEFESSSNHDVDDVFAQSVEPLVSFDLGSPTSEQAPMNGDSRLSSLSLTDSTSRVVKTSTYVQKDRISCDENQNSPVPVVEKAETIQSFTGDARSSVQHVQGSNHSMDLSDAEVITVFPNQSVTEVVMKELQERANRPRDASGHKTSTIIITAATRSDDSSTGTPSAHWDVPQSHQFPHQEPRHQLSPADSQIERAPHQPPPQQTVPHQPLLQQTAQQLPQQPQLQIPRIAEPSPSGERKSRLSTLKKRFTRTKDKKPRSHSIERSSGIDEHRYLDPSHNTSIGGSKSQASSLGLPASKKKFGGSLRKLFGLGKRSSSASRRQTVLTDLDREGHCDRLSIDGDRPGLHSNQSSMERDMTPPHRRTISSSSSYNNSYGGYTDPKTQSETMNVRSEVGYDYSASPPFPSPSPLDRDRRYSLPSQQRGVPSTPNPDIGMQYQ